MKNIFSQTVKGVAPQEIKKKYDKVFLAVAFLAILLAFCLYFKIIPARVCVLLWGLITGGWFFYDGYLGVKYKMIGRFGSFPQTSGPVAVVFGWVLIVLSLLLILLSFLLFFKLEHYVI